MAGSSAIDKFVSTANACLKKNIAECADYFDVSPTPDFSWCAWFVSQCAKKAGLFITSSNSASGVKGVHGNHDNDGGYKPKVGDLVMLDYSSPYTTGGISHTGLIVAIDSNGKITTVEGNMSGSISTSYVKNGKYNSDGTSTGFGKIVRYGQNS